MTKALGILLVVAVGALAALGVLWPVTLQAKDDRIQDLVLERDGLAAERDGLVLDGNSLRKQLGNATAGPNTQANATPTSITLEPAATLVPTINIPATVTPAIKAALPTPAPTTSSGSDRSQGEVIDLSPSVADSSIHAEVGDRVEIQIDVPGYHKCQPLKVRDPFGNVVAELTENDVRDRDIQFRGAFFAATTGAYVVELNAESENLNCGSRSFPARAEVKWTVQP